jgi:hypothetical protein
LGPAEAVIPRLPRALAAFGTPGFAATLKQELLALDPALLPLDQATCQGGLADTENLDLTVLAAGPENGRLVARIGVFFTEVVGGCSCGDEPLCATAYGQFRVVIDRRDASVRFSLA